MASKPAVAWESSGSASSTANAVAEDPNTDEAIVDVVDLSDEEPKSDSSPRQRAVVVPITATTKTSGPVSKSASTSPTVTAAKTTTTSEAQTTPTHSKSSATSTSSVANADAKSPNVSPLPEAVLIESSPSRAVTLSDQVREHYAEEMWTMLVQRWRAAHSPSDSAYKAQRVVLMIAANFLYITVRFGAGIFLALTPYLHEYFWVNGTLVGGGAYIDASTAIGLTDSMGSCVGSICNMAVGCVITACVGCGTLKGRLLFVAILTTIATVAPFVGLMFADTFWAFFGWSVLLFSFQGVMTTVQVPVQLLIVPEHKFLIQALSDMSLYVGGLTGLASMAAMDPGGDNTTDVIVTFNDVISCTTKTNLGLWGCMHLRMKGYTICSAIGLVTFALFIGNVCVVHWKPFELETHAAVLPQRWSSCRTRRQW